MATGTVVFQSATLASPPATLAIMADAVNDSDHGSGTTQYVKIMDATTAGTAKASVTTANGLAVDVTRVQGTVQALGTVRALLPAYVGEGFFGTTFTGAVTNGTLVAAPGAGTSVRVYDMLVNGSAAGTAFFEFGDGTTFGHVFLAANGGWAFNSSKGVKTRAANLDILFNASSGTWGVAVSYALET
jgi:hypothetical protein